MRATIQDIVKNNLCIGCGVCVSESNGASMVWNEYGFRVPDVTREYNDKAIEMCPFNPAPDKEVEDEDKIGKMFLRSAPHHHDKIGYYNSIYVGYSEKFRKTSSSGGIGTYVSEQLLKQKIVDHLFVVGEENGAYAYKWIDNVEQVRSVSKTRYYPVSMEKLFHEIDQKEGKVAVSGIPPFLKAIRLKQYYYPKYREKIPFLIGIICGGWKSRFFTDFLAQKAEIKEEYSDAEYRIKDNNSDALNYSFGAFDSDKQFHQIKMRSVGDMWGTGMFNNNASDFSDDVTAELGDISLGDAWINPYKQDGRGASLFVTRSHISEAIIKKGISGGELKLETLDVNSFIQSQQGAFRHRQTGMKYRITKLKQEGSIVPFKRKRLLVDAPIEYRFVQKQRRKLRKESLEVWRQTKNISEFEAQIKKTKAQLVKNTLWYHRLQSVRRKLGLRTI